MSTATAARSPTSAHAMSSWNEGTTDTFGAPRPSTRPTAATQPRRQPSTPATRRESGTCSVSSRATASVGWRAVLGCATWEEANATSRAIDGRGLAHQVFNLLPKIREVDRVLSPSRQARIVEAHPELCFASIAGEPLLHSKRSVAGKAARIALVGVVPNALPGAATDDVLDAHAALWTARRVAVGDEERLGGGERDGRGLRMEIVR